MFSRLARRIVKQIHLRCAIKPSCRDPAFSHGGIVRVEFAGPTGDLPAWRPPLPNGSSTIQPLGAPARIQGRIRSGGKVVKLEVLKLCVGTVHTVRLFRSFGITARAESIDSLSLIRPMLSFEIGSPEINSYEQWFLPLSWTHLCR